MGSARAARTILARFHIEPRAARSLLPPAAWREAKLSTKQRIAKIEREKLFDSECPSEIGGGTASDARARGACPAGQEGRRRLSTRRRRALSVALASSPDVSSSSRRRAAATDDPFQAQAQALQHLGGPTALTAAACAGAQRSIALPGRRPSPSHHSRRSGRTAPAPAEALSSPATGPKGPFYCRSAVNTTEPTEPTSNARAAYAKLHPPTTISAEIQNKGLT